MLNLTVRQRMHPSIEEILIIAAQVTFYEFNIDTNQWLLPLIVVWSKGRGRISFRSQEDVEGSLFVVKRNKQTRFQFIVMNWRNTENLVENLLGDFEYKVQVPYLLYRNVSQEVNGIWFTIHLSVRRLPICLAVLFLSRILSAYAKVPLKLKVPSSKSEFEELEAVWSMSVIEGPLEPPSTASAETDGPDESAFDNFSVYLLDPILDFFSSGNR